MRCKNEKNIITNFHNAYNANIAEKETLLI